MRARAPALPVFDQPFQFWALSFGQSHLEHLSPSARRSYSMSFMKYIFTPTTVLKRKFRKGATSRAQLSLVDSTLGLTPQALYFHPPCGLTRSLPLPVLTTPSLAGLATDSRPVAIAMMDRLACAIHTRSSARRLFRCREYELPGLSLNAACPR